jgi:agmatine deiminase
LVKFKEKSNVFFRKVITFKTYLFAINKRMVAVSRASSDEPKKVRVGLIQTAVSDDISENMSKTVDMIESVSRRGAQIICLQELFRTKYFPQEEKQDVSNLAETVPGETTRTFSKLAEKNNAVIIAPIFEKASNGKYYNSAVVIDADGKALGVYRKMHVPCDPLFYEKNFFDAGDKGYCVFETRHARLGVLICYDQWFPEAARINALKGAEILFYPTAIGHIEGNDSSDGDWHDAWKTIQRAHAIANGIHVASVNRVGVEGRLKFWGGSFVCDSFGVMLKEASRVDEETLVVDVDLAKNQRIQEGWGFIRNRRPDTYRALVEEDT